MASRLAGAEAQALGGEAAPITALPGTTEAAAEAPAAGAVRRVEGAQPAEAVRLVGEARQEEAAHRHEAGEVESLWFTILSTALSAATPQ